MSNRSGGAARRDAPVVQERFRAPVAEGRPEAISQLKYSSLASSMVGWSRWLDRPFFCFIRSL